MTHLTNLCSTCPSCSRETGTCKASVHLIPKELLHREYLKQLSVNRIRSSKRFVYLIDNANHLNSTVTTGLLLCSFVIWGDYFEGLLLPQSTKVQPGLNEALFTILILSLDVFLPIPVTLVIATQGNAYGLWTGCMIGVTGTTIAGTLAYLLCRVGNKRTAKFLLGQKALEPTKNSSKSTEVGQ